MQRPIRDGRTAGPGPAAAGLVLMSSVLFIGRCRCQDKYGHYTAIASSTLGPELNEYEYA